MDKLFTGVVLIGLVSSAYVSYYLRPWRRLSSRRKNAVPDNPYAEILITAQPDAVPQDKPEKAHV